MALPVPSYAALRTPDGMVLRDEAASALPDLLPFLCARRATSRCFRRYLHTRCAEARGHVPGCCEAHQALRRRSRGLSSPELIQAYGGGLCPLDPGLRALPPPPAAAGDARRGDH